MGQSKVDKMDNEIIEKHMPEGGEDLVGKSLFTKRELAAYLLLERTGLTWAEAAEEMGITYGTYSGKIGRNVKNKKEKAQATVKLIDLIEGSDE